ncbi:translation initiation factor 2 [Pseudomonas sp. MAFF212428]|uniref:Translation initiation factor 2 n=1 Tax=Pseudomonas brassicae TaxID=2708063 RepID=A0A6B3NLD4_9PSED|nr:translation initiation factor 2 [Pseudomonas brassicae]NER62859.1 translation initiation factor 2 [Pseudomonas brassicae]
MAVPVVAPVLLAQSSAQPAAAKATPSSKAAAKPKPKPKPKSKPVVRKKAPAKAAKSGKRNASEVIAAPLPKARLDLSLPPEMVKELQPPGQLDVQARRPLLPALFQDKPASDSPFQLNGRLLSNEMQLQLRNDSRQDVEGAAIDFEFKQ